MEEMDGKLDDIAAFAPGNEQQVTTEYNAEWAPQNRSECFGEQKDL